MLDDVISAADGDSVSIDAVVHSVGSASFAPILLLPALAVATPLSGIPLFSSLMGVVIALVAVQMIRRNDRLWLPGWVLRRTAKGSVVRQAFGRVYPVAKWLDARTHHRLGVLTQHPFLILPQLVCLVSGLVMPILEFVPFSSSIVGIGVAILAVGMVTRDGVLVVVGLVPYAIVAWLIFRIFS